MEALSFSDLHVEGDGVWLDQSAKWEWPVSTAYTPYGIRMLDGRFCAAIRCVDTMDECRRIGDALIACTNFHPTLKENLMLNLVNVMTHLMDGSHRQTHACTSDCVKVGKHGERRRTCQKKALDHFERLPG